MGRALTFCDAEVIKMASEDFIPVAADDWYQRRRIDAEGDFFLNIANQGPHKSALRGNDSPTRQGIYCLTPDGLLLMYECGGRGRLAMREALQQGLANWQALPEERRRPGAVKIDDLKRPDPTFHRSALKGGLVIQVYARALESDSNGQLGPLANERDVWGEAARDRLWLTESESQALVPAKVRVGDSFPLSPAVAERIARFHLIDITRGEPPMWQREQVRSQSIALTVEEADDSHVQLRLEGAALMATHAEADKANRGYDVRLLGQLNYDVAKKTFTRFDVVALGDHWGVSIHTRGARPGRTPLGVAFELCQNDSQLTASVPPAGARSLRNYLGTR